MKGETERERRRERDDERETTRDDERRREREERREKDRDDRGTRETERARARARDKNERRERETERERERETRDELLVVDLAVAVNVRLADHLVNLLVSQRLAEVGHDVAELGGGDEAVAARRVENRIWVAWTEEKRRRAGG